MERETNAEPAPRAARVELLLAVARDTAASLQVVSSQLQTELAGAARAGSSSADEVSALRAEVAQLRAALESRAVIEQAKGVLMARCGCDADTAFAMLCTLSRTERRKVRDVATTLVAAVVAQQSSLVGARDE
jgi:AmiR/NasT family two-component response regulator